MRGLTVEEGGRVRTRKVLEARKRNFAKPGGFGESKIGKGRSWREV